MMPRESLMNRVERLEKTVDGLQTLPAEVAALGERVGAVELQIVQLRADMNAGFSAVRGEMKAESAALRGEMQSGFATVRDEMLVGLANVTSELGRRIQEVAEEGKRHLQEVAEEGKRHTLVLFEEVLGRIATLGEQRSAADARKPRGRRKR